jgi:hypothetical protein
MTDALAFIWPKVWPAPDPWQRTKESPDFLRALTGVPAAPLSDRRRVELILVPRTFWSVAWNLAQEKQAPEDAALLAEVLDVFYATAREPLAGLPDRDAERLWARSIRLLAEAYRLIDGRYMPTVWRTLEYWVADLVEREAIRLHAGSPFDIAFERLRDSVYGLERNADEIARVDRSARKAFPAFKAFWDQRGYFAGGRR